MKAIYDSIYRDLLDKIESGAYPYQSFIPSENTLVKTYDCSHNTVRRALALLAQKGYVQPINGRGVRVIHLPHDRARFMVGGIETFKEAAGRSGLASRTQIRTFELVSCDDALAQSSGFEAGSPLIHIDRVRVINGMAQILDHNYFLEELLPGLTPQIAERSIFEYIEGTLGVRVTTSKRTITAEKATADDIEALDLGSFDFVAVMTNHTFNSDGRMFEYTVSRHRPDCFSFSTIALREG